VTTGLQQVNDALLLLEPEMLALRGSLADMVTVMVAATGVVEELLHVAVMVPLAEPVSEQQQNNQKVRGVNMHLQHPSPALTTARCCAALEPVAGRQARWQGGR
jgi:hypothetical protein